MFETSRLIRVLKKLTNNAGDIPLDIIKNGGSQIKANYFSVEDTAVMVVRSALNLGYIDRNMLTKRGEELVSEDEKFEEENL